MSSPGPDEARAPVTRSARGAVRRLASWGVTEVALTRRRDAWWGRGPGVVGYVAATDDGLRRIAAEASRAAWAAALGIGTPRLVCAGDGRLVRQRLAPARLRAADAEQLVAVADRLSAAEEPATFEVLLRWGDAGWLTLPERVLRALAHRLPVREFVRVRAEAAELAPAGLAHGDLRDANLLWDPDADRVALIDWEFLGPAPSGTDLLTLWALPVDPGLRTRLLEAALERAADVREVAVLAHWLALRQLFDLRTSRRHADESGRPLASPLSSGAECALAEARRLRQRLGAR